MTHIRPVLMGQLGYTAGPLNTALLFVDNCFAYPNKGNVNPHPVHYFFYGSGGSGYYNPENDSSSLTLSNIWNTAAFDTAAFGKVLKEDTNLVATFGLKRIAYEAGPSMDKGGSDAVKALALNDTRMQDLMLIHQKTWNEYGR